MATLISHPLVPLALRYAGSPNPISRPLLIAAVIATLLPDVDVIAFYYGISYADILGHRGFSHSIGFSVIIGFFGLVFFRQLRCTRTSAFVVLTLATFSHALLDAMTNGGLGVAFFWPLEETRYFLPWRPIEVSPIGLSSFISSRGLSVIVSEILWIWLPLGVMTLLARRQRK